MSYNSRKFLVLAGEKRRRINQRDQGHIEGITEPDKTRQLIGGIYIECTCQHPWLIGNDSDGVPIYSSKADYNVLSPVLVNLIEVMIVNDFLYHFHYIVRFSQISRHNLQQLVILSIDWISVVLARGLLPVTQWEKPEQFPYALKTLIL